MSTPNNASKQSDNVATFGNAGEEVGFALNREHARAISATLDEAGFVVFEDGSIAQRNWVSLHIQWGSDYQPLG